MYFILVPVAFVIAAIIVAVIYDDHKSQKEEQRKAEQREKTRKEDLRRVNKWIEEIEAANSDEDIAAINLDYRIDLDQFSGARLERARKKHENAQKRHWRERDIADAVAPLTKAETDGERILAYIKILQKKDEGICAHIGMTPLRVRVTTQRLFRELSERIHTDAEAFFDFRRMWNEYISLKKDHPKPQSKVWDTRDILPCLPDKYDEMAARYIENPALGDFQQTNKEPSPGEVRLLAASALRERSLQDAKIVLAFCSIERAEYGSPGRYGSRSKQVVWPYVNEIGDVLMAELAKMVDQIHQELKLFEYLEREV